MTSPPERVPDEFVDTRDRPIPVLARRTISELPELGERWLNAPTDPEDNRGLVAYEVATFIRDEFGRDPDHGEVRTALENTSDASIRGLTNTKTYVQ
jgi:hypothetical protein